eukprot:Nitzschia sp. Nitz4//scaffold167_size49223//1924//2457//NITZ4_007029-RA/size49223-processed-gene-0.4-mRNA-1//1//CDS//3329538257//3028//frame0
MGNIGSQLSTAEYEELMSGINRGLEERVTETKNTQAVVKFLDAFNRRNERVMRTSTSERAQFCFFGTEPGISLDFFLDGLCDLQRSFPDICVTYDVMEEIEPGVVLVETFHSRGTHTGAPFGFGPYPPLERTDIVVEETSDVTFHLSKGKIDKITVKPSDGDFVGPPGYYDKIGGML